MAEPAVEVKTEADSTQALQLYETELRNLRLQIRNCEEHCKLLADNRGPDGAELTLAWRRLQEARHRIGEALVVNNFAESFSN